MNHDNQTPENNLAGGSPRKATAGGAFLPLASVAIDFETLYSKDYSVSQLGNYAYTHHPAFHAYLVALEEVREEGAAGLTYCGEPENFDWKALDGCQLVAHNAAFDMAVFERLQELGTIPADLNVTWACTADLAVFHGAPRSLKGAAEVLLGVLPDKTVREEMKGVSWEEAQKRGWRSRLIDYCAADARLCARLWREYSPKWPAEEQRVSALNRAMGKAGIAVDLQKLQEARQKLGSRLAATLAEIPWISSAAAGSRKAFNQQCAAEGLTPPVSLDKNDPAMQAWVKENAAAHPWITAVTEQRSCRTMLEKLNTLQERVRPDGRAEVNTLLYFGAGTGRFSGAGGFNCQNLPRGEVNGVDLRSLFIPAPGHKFIISDLAQIEARVLLFLANDKEQLDRIRAGENIYQVHAQSTMGWTGEGKLKEEAPDLYRLAKARVLGLGYGCGAARFVDVAARMAGVELTEAESKRQVEAYRASNPRICALWRSLDNTLHQHLHQDFHIELPSGRELVYRDIHPLFGEWVGTVQGRQGKLYGGKLCENIVQALARDIFCHHMLEIARAGYAIRLHVHDEVVVEVKEAEAEAAAREINRIMSTAPDWVQTLPLAAETFISDCYTK